MNFCQTVKDFLATVNRLLATVKSFLVTANPFLVAVTNLDHQAATTCRPVCIDLSVQTCV